MKKIFCLIMLILVAGSVSGAVIDDIVAYWKFDEVGGDAIDAHASYDGTTNGVAYGATGKINDCFTFTDGDYVDMGDETVFEHTDGFSWSLWMKPSVNISDPIIPDFYFLMSKNSVGAVDGDVMLWWYKANPQQSDDGYLIFTITEGSTDYIIWSNSNSWTSGTWYHVVVTYDDATMRMYIDGVLQTDTQALVGSDAGTNSAPLRVAAHSTTAYTFLGEVDVVGVWDRTLGQSEVMLLHNSGSGLDYPFTDVSIFVIENSVLIEKGVVIGEP